MSRPEVDEVLDYLSAKFNKIFCDREFVCCVIEDFQVVLDKRRKTTICVLVFPTLGPIYLKALRYQARIFDLAVFNITSSSGRFKSIAVCHKDHLKKPTPETMSESVKRRRPERQLYVPPAQRVSRLSGKSEKKVQNIKIDDPSEQCSSDCVLNLCDVVNLIYFFNTLPSEFTSSEKVRYQHDNCQFRKFLKFKQFDSSLNYDYFIKIYDNFILLNNVRWKLSDFKYFNHLNGLSKSYPVYSFDNVQTASDTHQGVLVGNDVSEFQKLISKLYEYENTFYKVECDISCDEVENCYIVDLSVLELGHFFIISIEGSDHFHECQEKHDVILCCKNVRKQLELSKQVDKLNSAITSDAPKHEQMTKNITNETLNKTVTIETVNKTPENGTNGVLKNNKDVVKNKKNKKKASDKHEQEKEIMRMTKEFINRKTRPIMKYVDDSNDTLQIDTNESVNNWEDLFDDNGQIQDDLLTEIVDKVGDDITIVKANEDYTAYTNKPPEELEHIVELYNFPSTLETHDLVQAFSDINSDAMYIKWVDDTHALLVLGSLTQAQKAINMRNPLIKVRPMTDASAISIDVANKSDLRPAMKRPPTNLQTARRLITSHLGTKSKLSKEQIDKEKQDLKNAKEMKRLLKQNEKDAWEGKLRSTVT